MENRKTYVYILRSFLICVTVLIVCWIYSNSLKNAEESSSASGRVTAIIQGIIDAITGGESNIIVSEYFIRKLAHFTEYAVYGLFLMLTYLSFTNKKIYFVIPAILGVAVPISDELLQLVSEGRYCSPTDMFIDVCGTAVGFLIALAFFSLILFIIRNKKYKKIK